MFLITFRKLLRVDKKGLTAERRLTKCDQSGLVISLIDARMKPTANLGSPPFSRPSGACHSVLLDHTVSWIDGAKET
jgi:hypothetical protein